jgi:hypothetical protein
VVVAISKKKISAFAERTQGISFTSGRNADKIGVF